MRQKKWKEKIGGNPGLIIIGAFIVLSIIAAADHLFSLTQILSGIPPEKFEWRELIFDIVAIFCIGLISFILVRKSEAERREVEQIRWREKDKAQEYLDVAGVILLAINAEQKVTLINRKGCEILGYEEEEITGKNWFDHFLPEWERERVRATFIRLMPGGHKAADYFENPILTKSGEERIIAWHNTLLTDETGNVTGTLSSGEDITERKQAEEKIAYQAQLLAIVNDAVVASDAQYRLTVWNAAAESMYGWKAEEALGRLGLDITRTEFPDVDKAEMLRAIAECGSWRGEATQAHKDGTRFPVEVSSVVVRDTTGKVTGFVSVNRDITERKKAEEALKESEERFRQLAENIDQVFWLTDWDAKRLLYVNPAYERLYGRSCQSAYDNRMSWQDVIHPEDRARVKKAFARSADLSQYVEAEYRVVRDDGTMRWVLDRSYPIRDKYGRIYRFASVAEDITESKQKEEELKKSAQLLRDTGEMAKVGGWELDLSTKEVLWTEEVGRIHGVEPGYKPKLEEALNFYAPESRPALELVLKKTAETGEPYDLESLFIPSGSKDKIWVRSLGRAVYSGGKIVKLTGTFQNIDKYKRAEEALRESEEKYRALIEAAGRAGEGIIIIQDNGVEEAAFVFVNEQFCRMSGYSQEELLGRSSWDFIPHEIAVRLRDWYKRRRNGESLPGHYEAAGVHKDGTIVPLELSIVTMPWQGKIATVLYIRDITERKKAEEALRLSEDKFSKAFYASSDVLVISRRSDGVIIETNEQWNKLFGYEKEETIGRSSLEMGLFVNSEDRQRATTKLKEQGFVRDFEIDVRGKSDEIRRVILSVEPIEINSEPCMLTIIHDITESKRAEEALWESQAKLQSIFSAVPAGIGMTIDQTIRELNVRLCEITGYSKEELSGKSISIVYPSDQDFLSARSEIYDQLREKGYSTIEAFWKRKDGRLISVLLNCALLKLGDFSQGITFTVLDITERKKAEEAIRTERDKLENVTRNIGVGLAIISRDYQTVWANEVLKQIFGEVEGKLCYNIYNGRPDICPGCGVREVFEQGKDVSVHEQMGKDKDGNTIWSQIIATPLRDREGNITAAMEVVVPITERKKAEEALRESEERYRNFFENAPLGIYRTTPGGRILLSNPALVQMLGYSSFEELASRNLEVEGFEPQYSRNKFKESLEKTSEVRGLESAWLRRDGSSIFVRENARAVRKEDGSILYYEGMAEDITERKKAEEALRTSEERYRLLFERNLAGVFRTTLDGQILDCNESIVKMFGYDSREEFLTHQTWDVYLDKSDREKFISYLQKQKVLVNYEIRFLRKDGSILWGLENAGLLPEDEKGTSIIESTIIDITERKKAEEALRTSEEKYRAIVENATDQIFTLDRQCRFLAINKTAAEISRKSVSEMVGKSILQILPKETASQFSKNIEEVFETGQSKFIEERMCLGGKEFYSSTTLNPIKDDKRNVIAVTGIVRDITERKKAEEELKESEEKYRALLETTDTGFCILDSQGIIMDANSEYVRLAGHSTLAEIMGRNVIEWTAEHNLEKNAEEVKKCMQQGFVRNLEIDYVDKHGKTRPVEIDASVIQTDKGQRILTLCRDITERKKADEALRESEQRYRGVVDNIGIGVSLISPKLEILFLNDQMKKWFPNVDISKEATCYRAFNSPPKEEACSYCPTNKTLQDGQIHESITETPTGDKIINYRVVSSPINDLQGNVIAAIEMVEDITEKKRLQEQLIQSEKLAAVGTLAYGIAHEFNNILAGMMANAELGLISKEREQIKECFEIIVDNSHRASSITNNLLAFARHKEARKELVDITEPLKSVLAITHRELEKNNVEIIEKFKPVPKIYCDQGQFSEVFLNMITNARDAMHPKGGTLTIQVEPAEDDIRIVFKDTGCGIPEEIKGRIFEPFVTTKGALGRSEVPGTGLGLFLTYGIINGYKGKIEVETKVGKGTKFSIIIPISENQPPELLLDTWIESSKETEKKLKILLVDDEKAITLGLKKFLESKGHKVSTSLRAKEGLEIFRKGRFDLVLSDITIPDMDGIELIKKVKEKDQQVKIIVITGHIQKEKEEKAMEAGADEVLIKPFKNELLQQTISKVVD